MSVLALRLFDPREENSNETLGAKKMKSASENSILQSMAHSMGQGISEAMKIFQFWIGQANELDPEFKLNTDYTALMLDPQIMQRLNEMVDKGQMPLEVMWNLMREGEINLPKNEVMNEKLIGDQMISGGLLGMLPEQGSIKDQEMQDDEYPDQDPSSEEGCCDETKEGIDDVKSDIETLKDQNQRIIDLIAQLSGQSSESDPDDEDDDQDDNGRRRRIRGDSRNRGTDRNNQRGDN
jgi:hypothetical protein